MYIYLTYTQIYEMNTYIYVIYTRLVYSEVSPRCYGERASR